MTKLAHEKNLSMLISFIIEFLQFYNPRSPYWHLYFKHPCRECGLAATEEETCRFCKCKYCGNKHGSDACEGCPEWKQQSASAARHWLHEKVSQRCDNMDEDEFITLAKVIAAKLVEE
ncbi:hypothetical protein [Bacteroides sp.]|uniref:hypothetical protein n=1 Tax=Bacteroides sp. TaxID=29523 RepID=UPI002615D407|nr:hypothetical protein [Bacteroides sp.]MDD3040578.1 hypothetical protein [Bacteroides sp.]